MICPHDEHKMFNYEQKGKTIIALPSGGISNNEVYETWEIKVCPECGHKVKESYRCEVIPN